MIEAKDLSLRYLDATHSGPLEVLKSVSFEVPTGGFVTFVGPSGCGKSTLLRCIAGLLTPDSGSIRLAAVDPEVVRLAHRVAYVFQKPVFFDWLTVQGNVELLSTIALREGAREKASGYLKDFGLSKFCNAFPRELSGGMLSRAALARALAQEADFLLLDEAFDHLDEALRSRINTYVQSYWLDRRPTVLAVTHNLAEAVWLSDTVFTLSAKPASITARIDVPFPRPRSNSLLTDTSLLGLVSSLRDQLHAAYTETI